MGYRFGKEERERLEAARAYLAEHLEEPVRIAVLCAVAAMSRQKLNAGFLLFYGQPVSKYLALLRMQRARELLQSTEDSIGAIAAACGYQRQGSFSEAYKRHYGVVPREERKRGENIDPS